MKPRSGLAAGPHDAYESSDSACHHRPLQRLHARSFYQRPLAQRQSLLPQTLGNEAKLGIETKARNSLDDQILGFGAQSHASPSHLQDVGIPELCHSDEGGIWPPSNNAS
jgi:hypothetical protein